MAQTVLVICALVLTVALVVTLASLRRANARAEIVLQLVEREIARWDQVEALGGDVRTLSQSANRELKSDQRRGPPCGGHLLQDRRVVGVANSLASFRRDQRRRLRAPDGAQGVLLSRLRNLGRRSDHVGSAWWGRAGYLGLVLLGASRERPRRCC